jgi:hypothetical protein
MRKASRCNTAPPNPPTPREYTHSGVAGKVRIVLEAGDDLIVQGCYSLELIESALADVERMGGY